ncbi:MAG: 16S rRNA (guanine(966)-N(2))-methyltransferase RsmD [Ornithinibacter sp.]
MTRIIAGTARGRQLRVPEGHDTRPTSDRVREALFSRLQHQGWLDGTRVLDLYAGSGALGLEAVSRGAAAALLVEHDARTARLARANAEAVGLDGVRVVADRAERALARPASEPFDLVLLDPPYDLPDDALARVLTLLSDGGWLADPAAVVVERGRRSAEPSWPDGLVSAGDRSYGTTHLYFAETAAPD